MKVFGSLSSGSRKRMARVGAISFPCRVPYAGEKARRGTDGGRANPPGSCGAQVLSLQGL